VQALFFSVPFPPIPELTTFLDKDCAKPIPTRQDLGDHLMIAKLVFCWDAP
jgi:hypothetical protein